MNLHATRPNAIGDRAGNLPQLGRGDPGDETTTATMCRVQRRDILLKPKLSLQAGNWTHQKTVTVFSNILAKF